jgi:hypothetical protein
MDTLSNAPESALDRDREWEAEAEAEAEAASG